MSTRPNNSKQSLQVIVTSCTSGVDYRPNGTAPYRFPKLNNRNIGQERRVRVDESFVESTPQNHY